MLHNATLEQPNCICPCDFFDLPLLWTQVKMQVKASSPSSLLKQCFVALSFFFFFLQIYVYTFGGFAFQPDRWVLLIMHEIRALKMDTQNVVRELYNDK